ncbi:MAG TPA: MFS transporter [Ktedonobacteraceae bacterium]
MSLGSKAPESPVQKTAPARRSAGIAIFARLPRNIYLLLLFTTGKGFQLSISALTLNYYIHSLGYQPEFIGLFSAMPAIGSLISAVPVGRLADRIGRKPVLLLTAMLTPLCLAITAIVTSAPLLLAFGLLQGLVSTAYWVTNLPLLVESSTEKQRVGVLALNSFLLLGIGALGNLLGGAIPEYIAGVLHVSAASAVPLRWGVFAAALFTFVFGLPLWFLREPRRGARNQPELPAVVAGPAGETTTELAFVADVDITQGAAVAQDEGEGARETSSAVIPSAAQPEQERWPVLLFLQLLIPDLVFTMGEGAVVALIQIYFVLRFHLLPGPLGVIFTISGLAGGIFSLTAPLFVKRWSKLRLVTTVQYLSAPLMVLIGLSPNLPFAIAGEYSRSFMRTLIEPVYAAFAMERISDKYRATLSGCYAVTWSIGFSIGPTIGGWLQTNVNLSTSFVFGALCLLIAPSLLLAFFGRRNKG